MVKMNLNTFGAVTIILGMWALYNQFRFVLRVLSYSTRPKSFQCQLRFCPALRSSLQVCGCTLYKRMCCYPSHIEVTTARVLDFSFCTVQNTSTTPSGIANAALITLGALICLLVQSNDAILPEPSFTSPLILSSIKFNNNCGSICMYIWVNTTGLKKPHPATTIHPCSIADSQNSACIQKLGNECNTVTTIYQCIVFETYPGKKPHHQENMQEIATLLALPRPMSIPPEMILTSMMFT